MVIDTEKIQDMLDSANRLNDVLIGINETIEYLNTDDAELSVSISHPNYSELMPLDKEIAVDEKALDFLIRDTVIQYLMDKRRFVESELKKVLQTQPEGGNK